MKRNIFEWIAQKEPIIYFELVTANEDEDIQYDLYTYEFVLDVRDFLKEAGLENKWTNIVPPTMDMSYEFKLTKKEMEWIKNLPDPQWCLQVMSEIDDLEVRAENVGEEMLHSVTWVKDWWREGYQIYIDYSKLTFIDME